MVKQPVLRIVLASGRSKWSRQLILDGDTSTPPFGGNNRLVDLVPSNLVYAHPQLPGAKFAQSVTTGETVTVPGDTGA
ncbi:MAG: hypothetical protein H0T17_04245 [Propionibacteriales bacterium]|nr:hypothetical protein [Propionibacteriales bacterium]